MLYPSHSWETSLDKNQHPLDTQWYPVNPVKPKRVVERDQQSEEPAFRTTCRATEFLRPSALCVKFRARQTKSGIKKANDPFPIMKHPETMVFRWGFTRIGNERACLVFHTVCIYRYTLSSGDVIFLVTVNLHIYVILCYFKVENESVHI